MSPSLPAPLFCLRPLPCCPAHNPQEAVLQQCCVEQRIPCSRLAQVCAEMEGQAQAAEARRAAASAIKPWDFQVIRARVVAALSVLALGAGGWWASTHPLPDREGVRTELRSELTRVYAGERGRRV